MSASRKKKVGERLSFADHRILSFKPHDTGVVFRHDDFTTMACSQGNEVSWHLENDTPASGHTISIYLNDL